MSDEITSLIQKATNPSNQSLEKEHIQNIKLFAKKSTTNVDLTFTAIWEQLKRNDLKVRFLSIELIDILSDKSDRFRKKVYENINEFVELTFKNLDSVSSSLFKEKKSLSARAEAHKKQFSELNSKAAEIISKWTQSHGSSYPQLVAAQGYIDKVLKIKPLINPEQERKLNLKKRFEEMKTEFSSFEEQINSLFEELNRCSSLLHMGITFDDIDFGIDKESNLSPPSMTDYELNQQAVSKYGLGSVNYTLEIDIEEKDFGVKSSKENVVLLNALEDILKQFCGSISRKLNESIEFMSELNCIPDASEAEKSEYSHYSRLLLKLQGSVTEGIQRCNLLLQNHLNSKKGTGVFGFDSDSNSESEDENQWAEPKAIELKMAPVAPPPQKEEEKSKPKRTRRKSVLKLLQQHNSHLSPAMLNDLLAEHKKQEEDDKERLSKKKRKKNPPKNNFKKFKK
eukprot:c13625_g1_i1.p1 GENE.c13625_g1_i1~~c13625_g1_i1.p1  ORF type:complete len:454 (-),score=180.74 c13625_g1_i1:94-1455(-)